MVTGRCLCGTVQWRAEGPFAPLSHCHCSRCRKAQAAPFATFTSCARDAFEWVAGEEAITRYASSENFVRPFCSRCGSTVPQVTSSGDRVRLPAGSMDQPTGLDAGRHIFVGSMADWYRIRDMIPQYEEFPA